MVMAVARGGNPVMVQYTPGTSYSAGDVVVANNYPFVAHADNPPSSTGLSAIQGSLAIDGGVYQVVADQAIRVGTYVFWDATASKVTLTSATATVPFGVLIAGPTGVASDAGPAADGDACYVLHRPLGVSVPLYSAVGASTAITNTTTETLFSKSVSIPANVLQPGDIIRVRLQGIATATNSTDTLTIKLYIGGLTGSVVVATAAVDVADNDIFVIDADIVIRTSGATGTFVAAGMWNLGVEGTATFRAAKKASTTIDTTAAQVIGASATWSVASSGNSCRLDVLDVQLLRR